MDSDISRLAFLFIDNEKRILYNNTYLISVHTYTQKEKIMEIPRLPEFKVNQSKNGYEIRTDILKIAKDLVIHDFNAKYAGWEVTQYKDEKTGQIISTVTAPEFAGLDKVLETAQKLYDFVNQSTATKAK